MVIRVCAAYMLSVMLALCSVSHATAAQKIIYVGVPSNMPPIAFVQKGDTRSHVRGLAVDLATQVNSALGYKTVFRMAPREILLHWLKEGMISYICAIPAATSSSVPGTTLVTTPFAVNRRILVNEDNVNITCEHDFIGKRIGVFEKDAYRKTLEKRKIPFYPLKTPSEGLQLLSENSIDAFVTTSGEITGYLAQQNEYSQIKSVGLSLERIPLALVIDRNNTNFQRRITGTLTRLERKGELDVLRDKWMGKKLYAEPTFWNKYQRIVIYSVCGLIILLLFAFIWTYLLRKQVGAITRKLYLSEQHYRRLFEFSPDMNFIINPLGEVLSANRFARILMTSNDSLPINFNLFDHLCSRGKKRLQRLIDYAKNGKNGCEELYFNPASDDVRTLEVISFKVSDGNNDEIVCIARDMTERLRLEKELMEAERLSVIGKMSAGLAHEINNPLGIILTNTEMIRMITNESALTPRLDAIQNNVERASNLTKQLLNFSVPVEIRKEKINLHTLLQECLFFLEPRLKNVTVDSSMLSANLPIQGDKPQLEQLFLNLFLNALKSMEDHGKLTIRGFSSYGGAENSVRIEIQDSGKGIPKENLSKIFDMFFTTRNREGFGLGLFICRRVAEGHDGILFAESEEGKGATFILEMPFAE